MDLLGGPAAHGRASMQENLQQADDTDILDADAGIADRADGNGQGKPLEQREIDVHIQSLGLEAGKAVGNDLKFLTYGVEVIQSFSQAEVRQIVGEQFVAQEAGKLLILPKQGIFEVDPEDVMAVLDLFEDAGELAAELLGEPHAEDLADAIGGHSPQADFAASLEDFVDGEVALENKIPAVLDLGDGIETREAHLAAFFLGKLRPQDQCPVVELLADDLGTQAVGGGL